jgi:gas vesicle structural protein
MISKLTLHEAQQISLCEVLDRVLNKGVVVAGEAVISVADIELVYLGLQVILTSIETARRGLVPLAAESSSNRAGGAEETPDGTV